LNPVGRILIPPGRISRMVAFRGRWTSPAGRRALAGRWSPRPRPPRTV